MSVTDVSHRHHHTPSRQSLSSLDWPSWCDGSRVRESACRQRRSSCSPPAASSRRPPRRSPQAVGLTERTFFRHFSDKREVLFYGQEQFLQAFLDGVDAAPPDARPLEVIASALRAAASLFPDERRPYSRMRQSVIDQNPALQEREQHKLAGLATTVAEALRASRHQRADGHPRRTVRRHRLRNRVRAMDPRRRNAVPPRGRIGRTP